MLTRAFLATLFVITLTPLAGCGESSSSTPTSTGNDNSSHNKVAAASENAGTTTATATTAPTPTTGPLSKQPKVTPPSGPAPTKLATKDLIKGTGADAKGGQTVTVNYVGVLYKSGKEFDASWKRKEPFSFALGNAAVILGWDQGVVGMKVGGRRELIIPPKLAYGPKGLGSVPPNAPLIYVVDLLRTS
jgi:peptidylprolyl isomerase